MKTQIDTTIWLSSDLLAIAAAGKEFRWVNVKNGRGEEVCTIFVNDAGAARKLGEALIDVADAMVDSRSATQ
jgi:hypothetical protein